MESEDSLKSKEELIAEMAGLRETIAHLESVVEDRIENEPLPGYNDEYKIIVENSLEGVYICQDKIITFCNNRMARMFGFQNAKEAWGVNVLTLVSPKSHELVSRELDARESGRKLISHYTFNARRLDGSEFEVETLGNRVYINGKPAVQGVLRDVSEQKKLERQLRHSQKMEAIGTMAGGIAHDFNNILSVIIGYIELSRDEPSDLNRIKRNLEQILKASNRAKELVDQILSFSRQTEREKRPVPINSIVKEVLKLMRATLPATIQIRSEISDKVYVVMADSSQLHQVLMNLCTNAAHAMRESGGVLKIVLSDFNRDLGIDSDEVPAPYLRLSVSDTGHGMQQEIIDRIFDPFFTTKKPGEGTGLGLSVVHGIIRSIDGEISVESKQGEGTTFHLFIPILEQKVTTDKKRKHDIIGGSERILLIDDEVTLVNMAHKMLERLGYQVIPATDSLEALETFRNAPDQFDLVITDLTMPNMTGKQLAVELNKIRPGIPIILCTGFKRDIEVQSLDRLGIDALVMKPYSKKEIADAVRDVLDKN